MGKVIETIELCNYTDGTRPIKINAVVDSGAALLVLPDDIIKKLKLKKVRDARVRYADNRTAIKPIYGVVTVNIQGRKGNFDVLAESKGTQPLLGQIILEELDLMIDPRRRRLILNPESPDLPTLEIL